MNRNEDVAVLVLGGARIDPFARASLARGEHSGQGVLSAEELAVCAATGVEPSAFAGAKSDQVAQLAARNAGAVWIKGASATGISFEEARICALTGVSAEQFSAARDRKE